MQLSAGRLLQGGKYLINHPLETQGFGITYLGTDTEQGHSIVLKTLHPALHQSRAFTRLRDRFISIANTLSQCQHPQMVQVLDQFREGDWPFIVLEYIHGQSLAELVTPSRPMAELEALHYTRLIGTGLHIGHRQGLVHGNLKPQNILRRTGSNLPVLVGYGISAERMLAAVQYAVPGFPHDFTAPEQIGPKGDRVKSADLYGLAALLYFMLTGHPPRPGNDSSNNLSDRFPLLTGCKPALQEVICRGLAPNPQARPNAIDSWLKQLPDAARLKTTAAPQKTAGTATPIAPVAPPSSPTVLEPTPPDPPPIVNQRPIAYPTPTEPTPTVTPPERPRFRPNPPPPETLSDAPEIPMERPRWRSQPLPEPVAMPSITPSIAPPKADPRDLPTTGPNRPYATLPPQPPKRWWQWSLKQLLLGIAAIATASGITFGLALRFNAMRSPVGGSMFDAEQRFPSRNWEGSLTPSNFGDAPIETPTAPNGNPPPEKPNEPESKTAEPTEPQSFDAAPMTDDRPANSGIAPPPSEPEAPKKPPQPN